MDPEKKRTFNPWVIEKSFSQEIGSKPDIIRSINESEFVIVISKEKESKVLPTIKSPCSPHFHERVEIEIFSCGEINQNKGLIHSYDYNIPNIDDYVGDLKKKCILLDVQNATSIKGKKEKHYFYWTPPDFQKKEPPGFKEIPGE